MDAQVIPGSAHMLCAAWVFPFLLPVPVARGVYYRGRFQELALSSGTAHDVVMLPTHCLVLVDFIALYIYIFVIHILCVIVTFTYVQ